MNDTVFLAAMRLLLEGKFNQARDVIESAYDIDQHYVDEVAKMIQVEGNIVDDALITDFAITLAQAKIAERCSDGDYALTEDDALTLFVAMAKVLDVR